MTDRPRFQSRNTTAHIPGPRRKPKFIQQVRVPQAEERFEDDVTDGTSAPADVEEVTEDANLSDSGHEAPQPGGMQRPMSFGSVDTGSTRKTRKKKAKKK